MAGRTVQAAPRNVDTRGYTRRPGGPGARAPSPTARGTFAMRARARGASMPGAKQIVAPVPEWRSPQWKHRVEGEARTRLVKRLRGIPVP